MKFMSASLQFQGCSLAYEVRGAGPPVVLIQGAGVCGSGWAPQTERLCPAYTCLTFDNRGIGASQPAAGRLTISRMAADVLALMDGQRWESAHLVGHSMGGLIAMEVALTAPQRVRTLSLLCTFARGADATRVTPRIAWIGLRCRLGPRNWRRRAFMELVLPPGQPPGDLPALAERMSLLFGHDIADQPPVVMRQLAAMRHHDVTPRLKELAGIPTLVVSAQYDMIAPPAGSEAIAAGIPNSRYVQIPNAAHSAPGLQADLINALLLEHLSGGARQK